jgi:hypothetical protein
MKEDRQTPIIIKIKNEKGQIVRAYTQEDFLKVMKKEKKARRAKDGP